MIDKKLFLDGFEGDDLAAAEAALDELTSIDEAETKAVEEDLAGAEAGFDEEIPPAPEIAPDVKPEPEFVFPEETPFVEPELPPDNEPKDDESDNGDDVVTIESLAGMTAEEINEELTNAEMKALIKKATGKSMPSRSVSKVLSEKLVELAGGKA